MYHRRIEIICTSELAYELLFLYTNVAKHTNHLHIQNNHNNNRLHPDEI